MCQNCKETYVYVDGVCDFIGACLNDGSRLDSDCACGGAMCASGRACDGTTCTDKFECSNGDGALGTVPVITFGTQTGGSCTDPSDKGAGTFVTDITECNAFGNWISSSYASQDADGNYYLPPSAQDMFQPGCTYLAYDSQYWGGGSPKINWNPKAGTPACRSESTQWTCVCKYTLTEKCRSCVDGYAMNDANICVSN